jgi:hypothetical protein
LKTNFETIFYFLYFSYFFIFSDLEELVNKMKSKSLLKLNLFKRDNVEERIS